MKKLDQKPRFTTVMLHYGGWDSGPCGGGEDEMNPRPDLTRLPKVSLPRVLVLMTSEVSQIWIRTKRITTDQEDQEVFWVHISELGSLALPPEIESKSMALGSFLTSLGLDVSIYKIGR